MSAAEPKRPMKVGILTSHPIQYQVPWFRALAARDDIDLTVFFCFLPTKEQQGVGFNVEFEWDIPLLDGYDYQVLENVSPNPGSETFGGCDTPSIREFVKDGGFDAFIVNGWVVKSCVQLLVACRRYGVPCIVRGESNNLRPRGWHKRLIHRILLSQYAACLYIGTASRNFYLQNGVKAERLFFAPYCVENDRFRDFAERYGDDRATYRQQWGVTDDRPVFLFCGKFIDKKRPLDIMAATAALRRDRPDARFHILMVGSGDLFDEAQAFAQREQLPVTFCGFLNQSQIAQAYIAADVQILPSDNGETWGLVVNEGMVFGLPAIVSDQVGCHLNLVTPHETGDVYPMGDVDALAAAMARYIDDPAAIRKEGDRARDRIQDYDYDTVVSGTMAALEYVLAGKKSRKRRNGTA